MFKKKNKSKIKTNNNSLKTLYQHLKGIPPSPNWGNNYSSIIFKDKYLIYISNSFIIVIDLENKVFSQILSSNSIENNDRLNVICSINEQIFIITNLGKLIIYQIINNKFVEDLDCENKFNINFNLNVKCFDYIENNNIIYTSNNSNFEIYNLLNDSIKKLISIPFKDDNSIMIIKHLIHNNKIYITLGLKNGSIEIFLIENSESFQSILKIESKKNMIFSLDYLNEILFSIDKNGTLKAYKIDFENKQFEILFIEKDKYNDKSINERYLYFSIFCISNNKIIISSNQGRIFIYNYETKENKEISENPHKSSIFSIKLIKKLNQICFISSDDLISFFSNDSFNFLYHINTISKKIKFISVNENIIYFLIQNHQENVYIYKYNYTKELNTLNTIKREIEEKNEIKEFKVYKNQILYLRTCLNKIYVYDFDNDKITFDNFLSDNEMKILYTSFFKDNIYFIDEFGSLIKFNLNEQKTIKYNIINDEITIIYKSKIIPLEFIENDINIIILYSENYIYIFLVSKFYSKNILKISFKFIPTLTLKDEELIHNIIDIFIKEDKQLKIFSLNFSDLIINSPTNYNEYLNYKEYLDKYQPKILEENFSNFFPKNIINFKLGNNNKFLSCQSDGVINYYTYNNERNEINLLYRIRTSFLITNNILFIDDNLFMVFSNELCLKIFSPNDCIILSVKILSDKKNGIIEKELIINKSFIKLTSSILFQQSLQNSKKFSDSYKLENNLKDDEETYIFSYYNNGILNLDSSLKIIEKEKINLTNQNDNNNYLLYLYQYLMNLILIKKNEKEKKINIKNIELIYEKNNMSNEKIINILLQNGNFIECLLYIKINNLGIDSFLMVLEKIKYFLYLKQSMFQVIKIQKIIESHKIFYNISK